MINYVLKVSPLIWHSTYSRKSGFSLCSCRVQFCCDVIRALCQSHRFLSFSHFLFQKTDVLAVNIPTNNCFPDSMINTLSDTGLSINPLGKGQLMDSKFLTIELSKYFGNTNLNLYQCSYIGLLSRTWYDYWCMDFCRGSKHVDLSFVVWHVYRTFWCPMQNAYL